jgi:hypothetical protein
VEIENNRIKLSFIGTHIAIIGSRITRYSESIAATRDRKTHIFHVSAQEALPKQSSIVIKLQNPEIAVG